MSTEKVRKTGGHNTPFGFSGIAVFESIFNGECIGSGIVHFAIEVSFNPLRPNAIGVQPYFQGQVIGAVIDDCEAHHIPVELPAGGGITEHSFIGPGFCGSNGGIDGSGGAEGLRLVPLFQRSSEPIDGDGLTLPQMDGVLTGTLLGLGGKTGDGQGQAHDQREQQGGQFLHFLHDVNSFHKSQVFGTEFSLHEAPAVGRRVPIYFCMGLTSFSFVVRALTAFCYIKTTKRPKCNIGNLLFFEEA